MRLGFAAGLPLQRFIRSFKGTGGSLSSFLPALTGFGLLLTWASPQAATLHVPSQYTTIGAALTAASSGDTVLVADGTYSGAGNYDISIALATRILLTSEHGPHATVIDCQFLGPGISVRGDSSTVEGFHIKRSDGRAIDVDAVNVVIQNCIVSGCQGTGIYVSGNGNGLVLSGGLITGNSADEGAGLLLDHPVDISLINCTIAGNYATSRGGGIRTKGTGGTIFLDRCVVWGNCAPQGGGVLMDPSWVCNFTCSLYDSTSIGGSGTVNHDANTLFTDPQFCFSRPCSLAPTSLGRYTLLPTSPCLPGNNTCGLLMGGAGQVAGVCDNVIHVPADASTIQEALDGATSGDTVLVADGTYSGIGNTNLDFGGKDIVLRSENGPQATVIDCGLTGQAVSFSSGETSATVFQGFWVMNGAGSSGAINVENGSSPQIKHCMVSGCTASGIRVSGSGSSPLVRGCLIFGNTANEGGGLILQSSSNASLTDCTIAENRASKGGGVRVSNSAVTLTRCVLRGNCSPDGSDIKNGGTVNLLCSVYDAAGVSGNALVKDAASASADPLFCSPRPCNLAPTNTGSFTVQAGSPCLPENNGCGLLIGGQGLAEEGCDGYFHVPAEYATIQEAIDAASEGDTILVADGTYTGTGNKDLNFHGVNLVLLSENGARTTVIDCEGSGQGMLFESGETTLSVVQGFTFRNGDATKGGGILADNAAAPTIRECIFAYNHAGDLGGAVAAVQAAAPQVVDCIIANNSAQNNGGGLCSQSGAHMVASGCTIAGNSSNISSSGGGGVSAKDSDALVTLNLCLVWNNSAATAGRGEAFAEKGEIVFNCSVVDSLEAEEHSGGIITYDPDCRFTDPLYCLGATGGLGAPLGVASGSPALPAHNGCGQLIGASLPCGPYQVPFDFPTIQSAIDLASSGDTILVAAGTYTGAGNRDLDFKGKDLILLAAEGPDSTTIDCQGTGRGANFLSGETPAALFQGFTVTGAVAGAILCEGASPTIRDCVLEDNSTAGRGGGIRITSASPVVESCVIRNNTAGIVGGGVASTSGGISHLIDCTITGNRAATGGGGVSSQSDTLYLTGCTVAGNLAITGGGGIQVKPSSCVSLSRTILWGNCGSGLFDEAYLEGSSSTLRFTCSIVDSSQVHGAGVVLLSCNNTFEDPMFCVPTPCGAAPTASGDYTLNQLSPGMPDNSPCGLQVGALGQGCAPSTVVWTGDGDGTSWDDSLNWGGTLPGTGDNVVIPDVLATTEVLFSSGTANIATLLCSEPFHLSADTLNISDSGVFRNTVALSDSGVLGGTGNNTFKDMVTWTGGTMTGTGGVSTIEDTLVISGSDPKALRGGKTLRNLGHLNWSGGTLRMGYDVGGAMTLLENAHCGKMTIAGARTLQEISGGGAARFLNEGTLRHEGSGVATLEADFENTGTLAIPAGTLSLDRDFVNFTGGSLTGGTYTIQGTLRFTGADVETLAAAVTLDGTASAIVNDQGNDGLAGFAYNGPDGDFTITNGRQFDLAGGFINEGRITVDTSSLLHVLGAYHQTLGTTDIRASTSTFTADTLVVANGVVSGNGTVNAPFINSGILRPGSSPGTLTITSSFICEPEAEIEIEVAGLAPGQHDMLEITGNATLDGILRVIPVQDTYGVLYQPSVGDSLDFMTAQDISGQFAEVDGFSVNPDTSFARHLVQADTARVRIASLHTRFVGSDGGSWFNPGNWSSGFPDSSQDVFVECAIQLNQQSTAKARSVRILPETGSLQVERGTLVAGDVEILSDSTTSTSGEFRLDGDAMVQLGSLVLGPLTEPDWRSGTIEIDGGVFSKKDGDLIVGQASGTSRLVLKNGAVAQIPAVLQIGGASGTEAGELVIDGPGTTLNVGKLLVGGGGPGTVTLSQQGVISAVTGVISAPQVVVSEFGTLNADGTIIGKVINGGTLDPGGPGAVGTLNIVGNYSQSSNEPGLPPSKGTVRFDVGSLPEEEFDTITISGGASLAGILDVNIMKQDYMTGPEPTVMTWASKTGMFDSGWADSSWAWVSASTTMVAEVGETDVKLLIRRTGTPGLEPPKVFRLLPNAPNPFHTQTVITFDLPEPKPVQIRIFDVTGRLVRTLVDGAPFDGGRHTVPWTGYDTFGRPAAAGVYFYTLRAGPFFQTRRMVLVK